MTKTRWSEKPLTLVPMLLNNIKNFAPGESKRKFEQGRQETLKKEQALLDRLKQLPNGEEKAKETKRMIDLIRNFAGYREYPKYGMVNCYFVYKQALLKEAERSYKPTLFMKKKIFTTSVLKNFTKSYAQEGIANKAISDAFAGSGFEINVELSGISQEFHRNFGVRSISFSSVPNKVVRYGLTLV
jgi:phosphoenolpyruvate synthase/pyruvate phosphate dikinase